MKDCMQSETKYHVVSLPWFQCFDFEHHSVVCSYCITASLFVKYIFHNNCFANSWPCMVYPLTIASNGWYFDSTPGNHAFRHMKNDKYWLVCEKADISTLHREAVESTVVPFISFLPRASNLICIDLTSTPCKWVDSRKYAHVFIKEDLGASSMNAYWITSVMLLQLNLSL